jgi:hypothetical protein
MNLLLRNTILSKNLSNVVFKYYDNSFKTLYKKYNKTINILPNIINPNITLKDFLQLYLIQIELDFGF